MAAADATGRPTRLPGRSAGAGVRHEQRRRADSRTRAHQQRQRRAARSTTCSRCRRPPACRTTASTSACASATCGPARDPVAQGVQAGVRETLRSGNLRGKPAIIVHGRADTQIPVNFNSRPYFGLNKQVEGAQSKLTYIEVTNAQHFEAFIDSAAVPGIRLGVHPAALLLHQGDGRDVRAPDGRACRCRRRRSCGPCRAAARRARRRRSRRPTCRRSSATPCIGQRDHVLGQHGDDSGLIAGAR